MKRRLIMTIRLVALVAALPLLCWAGAILSNISGYNDSGTLRYVLFSAVPGLPGLLLLAFAVFGRLWPRRTSSDPSTASS